MSSNTLPTNAIDIDTAEEWVNRWRATELNPPVKGFLIPQVDITSVMDETGFKSVRAYMGTELKDDKLIYHLLVVGVDEHGDDMIDPEKGEYVYDFTEPCPSTCSSTGVLK